MVSLIQDPNGEKIFENSSGTQDIMSGRKTSEAEGPRTKLIQLEAKIAQLEAELEHQKVCVLDL